MGLTLLLVQMAFGAIITAFAISRLFWVSNVLLFLGGAALLIVFSMTASLVQLIVPDHLRGRVVSIYMVAFRGGMPLGSLAERLRRQHGSVPVVLAVNGALVAVVAVYFFVRGNGVRVINTRSRQSGVVSRQSVVGRQSTVRRQSVDSRQSGR